MKLMNKTALITGGAQGIGLSIAETFCREGAVVYIGDMNEEQGMKTAGELTAQGYKVHFLLLNVSDEASWKNGIARIQKESGGLDILVNNAGINIRKNIEEMSAEELDKMYSVNIKGPFLGTKYVIPLFKAGNGGSIINMSSVCGLIGHKFTPEAYTTTKGAVTLLTKSVASRYGQFNIRCNSIHPSTADTPLVQEMLKDPERKKERLGEVPLGRMAGLNDIAEAALYLASDEAGFINGIALPVDGGVTAC
ncbi:SDR family NAD(P)-dependent oxidoreductase [Oceanispirochaeta sp.]|jgi:cyclopentanol dehydrogenase|uniref:SDR family NAD(P)-dependent oxidoreductase n=1 Tax=Oceanispirochaeta sp. TaxID=2035350 RepID=UPI00262B2972|nr:glucose 1-dehydrogenase [Oceanispirochaeta sp.]MDA3955591.1 glucose 1-dehydrogenase [Oceanispirochaeta sp.]